MAWRRRLLFVGIALLAVAAIGLFDKKPVIPKAPAPPVRQMSVQAPSSYWAKNGFVEMVAPIRPPTSDDLESRIVVYLKLPEGAAITARSINLDAGERATLAYPPGTIADRVEYFGRGGIDDPPNQAWFAADVRGTLLGDDREEFHVARPTSRGVSAPLLGIAWPRDNDAAQLEATRALGALLVDGFILGPAHVEDRAKSAEHLRGLNDCAGCHTRNRPPRRSVQAPGIVNRGTDASGFFQVSTVLEDRAPLETYRPRNANAQDPFVSFVCGGADAQAVVEPGIRGIVRCPGGEIPTGVLDLPRALRAADPHALRVCASRRFLYGRLDEAGRRIYREAMSACDEPH